MSSDLVRTHRQAIDQRHGGGLASVRVPRSVVRRVDAAVYDGLVAAARIQSAGYVSHVALTQIAELSALEFRTVELAGAQDPLQAAQVAARAKAVVDTFAALAAAEIAYLG